MSGPNVFLEMGSYAEASRIGCVPSSPSDAEGIQSESQGKKLQLKNIWKFEERRAGFVKDLNRVQCPRVSPSKQPFSAGEWLWSSGDQL